MISTNENLFEHLQGTEPKSEFTSNSRVNDPREAKNAALMEEYYKLVASESGHGQRNGVVLNEPQEEEKKGAKPKKKFEIKILSEEKYKPEDSSEPINFDGMQGTLSQIQNPLVVVKAYGKYNVGQKISPELKYLFVKRNEPRPFLRSYSSEEPRIEITAKGKKYVLTTRGFLDAARNTDHDDITIGSLVETKGGIFPNDICIEDGIGLMQCKIIAKHGFKSGRRIPEDFFAFLMMSHERLGENSDGKCLTPLIYKLIYGFIKEPRKFWLVDLGSGFPTCIAVAQKGERIQQGQKYLMGTIVKLQINAMCSFGPSQREFKNLNDDENYILYRWLCNAKNAHNTHIKGLDPQESEMVNKATSDYGRSYYLDTSYLQSFKRPVLVMELGSSLEETKHFYIFVAGSQNEFFLGSYDTCDVIYKNDSISRKHTRIVYENGNWYILDGSAEKPSRKGSWVVLESQDKSKSLESRPRALENYTLIKIENTFVKVEIFDEK